MTLSEANKIKSKVDELNKLYSPIKLTFQMLESKHPYDDNNWFVTIVFNYTENEWMTFYGLTHSYAQIMDKLNGYQFALEAVQAYQEEYGDLKFSHSDVPLG